MVLVLVAEDDRAERDYIAFRLEQAGFTVRTCATGQAAIEALGPDVGALVVEQRLPGLDGLHLCRRLRDNPDTAELPVLMVSDTATEDETLAAFAAGADDWLAEPVGLHELRIRVAALLQRCRRHPDHYHRPPPPMRRPRDRRSS